MRHPRAITLAVAALLLIPFLGVGFIVRDAVHDAVRQQFEQTLENDLAARAVRVAHDELTPADVTSAPSAERAAVLDGLMADRLTGPATHAVRLVSADGLVLHSTVRSEVGDRLSFARTVDPTGGPVADPKPHTHPDGMHDVVPLYELYVPVTTSGSSGFIVIDECYSLASAISATTARRLDIVIASALAVLFLATLPVVHRTTRRLRRHTTELEAALAEADAAHAVKDHFLEAVSHELRTPLTGIMGPAEVLHTRADRLLPEQRARLLETLLRSSRKLSRLITDMLDVDRGRRSALGLAREDTDVVELIDRCVREAEAPVSSITVDHGVGRARVDGPKFERVVDNLLRNAARHTPVGTPIRIRTRALEGELVLVVEDDGPGIPFEDRRRLFEPFERGSVHHHAPGTGVGLSIVKSFAQVHGGDAHIEESASGGARFVVSFAGAYPEVAVTTAL